MVMARRLVKHLAPLQCHKSAERHPGFGPKMSPSDALACSRQCITQTTRQINARPRKNPDGKGAAGFFSDGKGDEGRVNYVRCKGNLRGMQVFLLNKHLSHAKCFDLIFNKLIRA
jgi:hypothetical protein